MKSTPEHTCLHTVQIMDMAFKFAPSCDVLPDLAALVALRSRLVLDLAPLPPPMAAGSAAPPSGREGGHRAGYGGGERVDAHQRGGEGEGRHSTLLYGPPFKRGSVHGWQRRQHGMTADGLRGCTLRGGRPMQLGTARGTPPARVDGAVLCKTASDT